MFYNKLLDLCKEYGVKPTPVLKELGISPGNLKRWETGAAVNSDTLAKIADRFGVPVDYFFTDDEAEPHIDEDSNSVRKIYNVLRAYPDYIASAMTGKDISAEELKIVAGYLNCSVDYLLNGSDYTPIESNQGTESFLTARDLVMEILSVLAGNKAYRAVQVNISRIIINNLAKLNITREKLLTTNLAKKKIADLYNSEKSAATIWGLNNSDLIRISRDFKVSFNFMFTGQN